MIRRATTIVGILAWGWFCTVHAEWANVDFRFAEGEDNQVVGPNEAFESVKPASGPWTASYSLGNHYANLLGTNIRVFSANTVTFENFNLASGNAGMSSHICFRFRLSEPVQAFAWEIGANGRNVGPASRLTARYSTNGADWTNAVVYPPGCDATYVPAPVRAEFAPSTQDLYIGWFAEVPQGDVGWWNLGGTGTLTFAPVGTPLPAPSPATFTLQGERVVPTSFFGTTTHVNNELATRLLSDLNINCVRVDFHYAGLEPAPGQYNFPDDLWMLASANLGIEHGLDQLVVLTRAPDWALGPKGTFPNDQSVDALEELMYRAALKYKGKIRYWQAMNEPNMAVWGEHYITFLKAFQHGVKRADPENKVVLCGFAGPEPSHLYAVYRLGGKDYFDVLASHAYTRPGPPEAGFLDRIQAMHDVMTQFNDSKPLWVTESGWNGVEPSMLGYLRAQFDGHRTYACTEEDQARYLARLYLIAATVPWIERLYFFHLHQEAPYTEVVDNVDAYMGLFTPWLEGQIRPKDAYYAVKTVIAMIREATYKERIASKPDVWALVFQKDNEARIALWSLRDGIKMVLKDAALVQQATSMMGTPVLVEHGELELSGRPIYLKATLDKLPQLEEQLREACLLAGTETGTTPH